MDASELVAGLGERVARMLGGSGLMRPPYPPLAVELREDGVTVARVARRGNRWCLAGHAHHPLPEGTFAAGLMRPRVGDPDAILAAVAAALRDAGAERASRISVALPDTVGRVFLASLAGLPSSRRQALEVLRWHLKKNVPFDPAEARLTWQVLGRGDDGKEQVLVVLAPDGGISPIEELLEGAGFRVGLVDLASFGLYNALRVAGVDDGEVAVDGRRDVAILSATPRYFSMMSLRSGRLIFYRAKNYHLHGGFQGEESLRVVGREVRSTLSYYEEHLLGEGFARMHVRVVGIPSDGFSELLSAADCGEIVEVDPGRVVDGLGDLPREEALELLPAVGLALRRVP